jgi:NAD-dependent deacetylase
VVKKLYILTGAGISAESGIETFRGSNGLWSMHKVEDVATLAGWMRSPLKVWQFTAQLKASANRASPNAAHFAVAAALKEFQGRGIDAVLVTQNIDTLHERALQLSGLTMDDCVAMHGRLSQSRCMHCRMLWNDPFLHFDVQGGVSELRMNHLCFDPDLPTMEKRLTRTSETLPISPCCKALLRPDLVWFGEEPHELNRCFAEVQGTDVFVAIGTSGLVAPASEFVKWTARLNKTARTIFVNTNGSDASPWFNELRIGNASEMVPQLFTEICGTLKSLDQGA